MSKYITNGFLFAGFSLIFNPFFYGRFVEGQTNVYMSLLMLPFMVIGFTKVFSDQKPISYIFLGLSVLIFNGLSSHNLIFVACVSFIFTLVFFKLSRYFFKNLLLTGFVVLSASLPRILLAEEDGSVTKSLISSFNETHLQVFQPQAKYIDSMLVTLTTLHGYRGEGMNRFEPSYLNNTRWLYVWILIWVLVILGGYNVFFFKNKTTQKVYVVLLLMGILSLVLGGGTSRGGKLGLVTQRLYDNVYFYRGLREPHKRIMRLVFFYTVSGSFGIQFLYKIGSKYISENWIIYLYLIVFSILPIISTPALLFGAQGQIKTGEYPAERYSLRNELQKYHSDQTCGALQDGKQYCRDILVLPWHGYLSFPFTQGRVITNPIYDFMNNTGLMVSDSVELGKLYSQTSRRENIIYQQQIEPTLRGLLYESDLDPTRTVEFINDSTIHSVAKQFNYIGITDVIIFKSSPERKINAKWLSFLVQYGYATIKESNNSYVWYQLYLNDWLEKKKPNTSQNESDF